MSGEFFELLLNELKRTADKHPRTAIEPEVLTQFYRDCPKNAAAPAARPTVIPRPTPVDRPAPEPLPIRPEPPEAPEAETTRPRAAASRPISFIGDNIPSQLAGANWEQLEATVRDCRQCRLCERRTQTVFGEGNREARLMFIGEGPGFEEDRQGRPFVGPAGQLLDKMINAMGFRREDVYIGNIVKCRPPGNRDPEPEEAAQCLNYLRRQIELIKPEVIVTLGRIPLTFLLERREGITRIHGRWLAYAGIPVMPTFHPAYLLRQESAKRDAWNDLKLAMKALGIPVPPPKR